MALLNSYNYAKPKNHINININTLDSPKKDVKATVPVRKKEGDKASQYLEQRVFSAKPEELTYMLYEGLVRFIKKAIIGLDEKNIEMVNTNAIKAQNIIAELRITLNMDVPMSQDLDSLYDYMEFKLFDANIEKDKALFEEVLEMAVEFKNTWKEAFNIS